MNAVGYLHCVRNLITSKLVRFSTFKYGEQLISVDQKNRKKLFKLSINGTFENNLGRISHEDIEGHSPNETFRTLNQSPMIIRRPQLDEFIVLTKRRATIMYPKDIWTVIGMMDIGYGSTVIEAGTGSGALTLYLSRAVSTCGRIISFDVRKDHLDTAMARCAEWDKCLRCRGNQHLIDNIEFHNDDIKHAGTIINKEAVDAVCLDMVDPAAVIDTVASLVKTNGIVVVYLPNISQVIQLSKSIRNSSTPLCWDSVNETINREWTILPSKFKNKKTILNSISNETVDHSSIQDDNCLQESNNTAEQHKYEEEQYIARPSHYQPPHTAFLVKLRKV